MWHRKPFYRYLLIYALVACLLVAGGVLSLRLAVLSSWRAGFESQERADVQNAALLVEFGLRELLTDLLYISRSPELSDPAAPLTAAQRFGLKARFAKLMRSRHAYQQVRWIDRHGQEQVRVDKLAGVPVVTPPDQLQDKSGRHYVREALRLTLGQAYISRFDLNREFGEVEYPYTPVVRAAIPLFDAAGQAQGLVVINFDGQALIDRLGEGHPDQHRFTAFIDPFGYWLGDSPFGEGWGFMFDRPPLFATRLPITWERINREGDGSYHSDEGSVHVRRVDVRRLAGQFGQKDLSSVVFGEGAGSWWVASVVPRASLEALKARQTDHLLQLGVGLLVLLMPLCLYLARARTQTRDALAREQAAEQRLGMIYDALSTEVADRYFDVLANQLAVLLGAEVVFVGRLANGKRLIPVSASTREQPLELPPFELPGTPFQALLQEEQCGLEGDALSGLERTQLGFGGDDFGCLRGVALNDPLGHRVGMICALYRVHPSESAQHFRWLQLFAGRTAAELVRLQHESNLAESHRQLDSRNRELRVQSACNRSLNRATSEQQLVALLCEELVREGGYAFAWFGTAIDERAAEVHCLAHGGADRGYLDGFSPVEMGTHIGGEAIRQRQVLTQDHAGVGGGWPRQALAAGFGSSVALPVVDAAIGLYGVFRLYRSVDGEFPPDELALLEQLGSDLRIGFNAFRIRHRLAESEAQFRSLAEDASVGVFLIQERRLRYVNPRFAEIFRRSREQLIEGSTLVDLVDAAERARVDELLAGAEGRLEFSFCGVRGDGARVTIEAQGGATRYRGKAAIVGTLQDVTERDHRDQQLNLLGLAISAAGEGIAISDLRQPDNPFVYVNPSFEQMTGYASTEVVGRNGRFLIGEDRDQPALEELRQALRQHRRVQVELRCYQKNGAMFWNRLSVAPVQDATQRVTHTVSVLHDISERKRYEQQLERLSNYDTLTGLANRNLLQDRLQQALIQGQRNGALSALLIIDLRRFKELSQTLGQQAADQLLIDVAQGLRSALRAGDTLARVGNDQFAVVLQAIADEDNVAPLAGELLLAVSLTPSPVRLEASIGIAVAPRDGQDATKLLHNAQAALMQALPFSNEFRFFTPAMNLSAERRLRLEIDLRGACEAGQLSMHYQPKVDLSRNRIIGAEALIRWQHPELGAISPFDFIPLAEETGLINSIGLWALEQACGFIAGLNRELGVSLTIAVNFSAVQLQDAELATKVAAVLAQTGLSASQLECEMTESLLLDDPERARRTLRQLKLLGVGIALDDFGTGYSSLSYLRRFPIDVLKIDRSFVMEIPENENDCLIARSVIALGRSLQMTVVAEGVETAEQAEFICREGGQLGQGYYFSRPLPADQFRDYLLPQAETRSSSA